MSDQKQVFGVFRIQKIKCSNGGGLAKRLKHSTREFIADNVDKTRLNLDEREGANTYAEAIEKIRSLWKKADTRRSDSVGVLESIVTTTGKLPKGEEKDFLDKAKKQLKEMFGEDNIIGLYVHRDEKETHIHCFSVPLETKKVEKKHLSAGEILLLKSRLAEEKIEYQEVPKKPKKDAEQKEWEQYKKQKKDYEKYKAKIKPILESFGLSKTETTLSCQKICGSAYALSQQQDIWYEKVFKDFGLERGSKKERNTPEKYRNPTNLKKWAEKLEQDQKEFDEKVENEADEVLESYRQKRTGFLRGTKSENRINGYSLPAPKFNEKAKDYKKRIQPDIDALQDASKIFEEEYWTLRRKTDTEIQNAKNNAYSENQTQQETFERELSDERNKTSILQSQYNALEAKFQKTSTKLRNLRENTTPEQFRQIADRLEKSHCKNLKQYDDRQKGVEMGRF